MFYRLCCTALLAVSILGCQYPINDFKQDQQIEFLQFEAEITQEYARVLISNTSKNLLGNPKVERPVTAEEVYVTDSRGNRTDLPNDGRILSNFKGSVGETYTLHARIAGKEYESQAETMRAVPPIDTVGYSFNERTSLTKANPLKYGFDVFVRFKDLDEPGNYYSWVWTNYSKKFFCATSKRFGTVYNVPCENDCWEINYSQDITLFSDEKVNGARQDQPLVRIPFEIPPLQYYLRVEQRAVTANVYSYLRSAREQTVSTGGQFDVPAQTTFSTNIVCKTDPKEKVLGVFNVFSFSKKIIYVDRDLNMPDKVRIDPDFLRPTCAFPGCVAPCITSRFVTDIKPEGWKE